jgi:preprotein translocase subunit SecG
MREQESEDSSAQKTSAGGDSANQKEPQEYLTVATHGKRTRKSTILLAVLFCAGLICLFFMIKKSSPGAAAAATGQTEEKEVELAIARLTGIKSEIYTRMDEIVRKFDEFSDVQQVNVSELAKNPFRQDVFLSDLKEMSDTQRDSGPNDEAIRKQQLALQARGMHLLSIMQSERGKCCMIDDKILYENDSIKGFTVSEIGNNAVSLKAEGVEIVLKLSQ